MLYVAVICTVNAGPTHHKLFMCLADCTCRIESEKVDAKFNQAFEGWFSSVFKKDVFTCPRPPPYYYGPRPDTGAIFVCIRHPTDSISV